MSLREPSHDRSDLSSLENCARKPPVSERKIAANRRNALRSTGPKTARGKRTVARNAIKHGLLAREVVITAGDGRENLQDFRRLVDDLWKDYEPVGVVEETLVEEIATCLWRKARILRAENGEIRKRLDTYQMDRKLRNSDKVNLDLLLLRSDVFRFDVKHIADHNNPTGNRWSILQDRQRGLRGDRLGLEYQEAFLLTAKEEIGSTGRLSERAQEILMTMFAFCDFELTQVSQRSPLEAEVKTESPDNRKDERAEEFSKTMIEMIDERLALINWFKRYNDEREKLQRDAEARTLSLPPAETTDKLLRYETHMDRKLYRAMDQLERLQRLRSGEKVPPPLSVHLARKG